MWTSLCLGTTRIPVLARELSSRLILQPSWLYLVLNELFLTVCSCNSLGYITLKGEVASLLVWEKGNWRQCRQARCGKHVSSFHGGFCMSLPWFVIFFLIWKKTWFSFVGLPALCVFKTDQFMSTKGDLLSRSNSLRIYKSFPVFLESCPRRH